MSRSETRIVFMGTPDFAVPSLEGLLASGFDVVTVVTQPDRPRGRGHRLTPSAVKQKADEKGIPVLQIDKISSREGVAALRDLQPDFLVTVAFGQILSEELLGIPKYGCINVHASLLPAYRGASPIVRSVMRGDRQTGITTMYTVRELDAGPILLQDTTTIGPEETGGELTDRLSRIGASTLIRTLDGILDGSIAGKEQDESKVSYYPRFPKGYGEIDWERPAAEIVNFVRALNPVPGAYFMLGPEKVGVLRASAADGDCTRKKPGTIIAASAKDGLMIATGSGCISLDEIRRQGARAMTAKESLRGRPIAEGGRLRSRSTL